eukprot:TRINITY_DN24259_c0_g1_i1.p1 TRINITY_DN24259_c0_g1~~TRINITY_DN24259_c0_g1_i1.p1  ORF type:complete len:121 (-),score=11.87 TRINITY_DN24259_c0_g1_i1:70-432(-)
MNYNEKVFYPQPLRRIITPTNKWGYSWLLTDTDESILYYEPGLIPLNFTKDFYPPVLKRFLIKLIQLFFWGKVMLKLSNRLQTRLFIYIFCLYCIWRKKLCSIPFHRDISYINNYDYIYN